MSTKKPKSSNRKATTHSISMIPADWQWLEDRVKSFSPHVKGVSHYFQLLIEYDKRMGLIEETQRVPRPAIGSWHPATRSKAKKK